MTQSIALTENQALVYQGENEAVLNGWTVSPCPLEMDAYTTTLSVWGEVEVLKKTLFDVFA